MGDERDIQREAAALHRAATDDSQNEPPDFDDDEEGDSMAVRDEREGLPKLTDMYAEMERRAHKAEARVGQLTQELQQAEERRRTEFENWSVERDRRKRAERRITELEAALRYFLNLAEQYQSLDNWRGFKTAKKQARAVLSTSKEEPRDSD